MAAVHLSESDFQTLIAALLYFDTDVKVVREAQALGSDGGRIDLLIQPAENSPVKNTYLVEFKYLTKAKGKDKRNVTAARNLALQQARRYAQCCNIRNIPHLKCVAAVYVGSSLAELVSEIPDLG